MGWVFYLEGSTDLAFLRAFAAALAHPAQEALERPFLHVVQNQPGKAREHFYGLREACRDLRGFALFDRLSQALETNPHLVQWMWRKREIENYLCTRHSLLAWARSQGEASGGGPLFGATGQQQMEESISEIEKAMQTLGKGSPWEPGTKVTDDFLDPLFENFYRRVGLPNLMRKTDYHRLPHFVPAEQIDPEGAQVLDSVLGAPRGASPAR